MTDSKDDETFKGNTATVAAFGGWSSIESAAGLLGGAAVGLGVGYLSGKNKLLSTVLGSAVGGVVGQIHGAFSDVEAGRNAEVQFAQNKAELKELRSFKQQVLESRVNDTEKTR